VHSHAGHGAIACVGCLVPLFVGSCDAIVCVFVCVCVCTHNQFNTMREMQRISSQQCQCASHKFVYPLSRAFCDDSYQHSGAERSVVQINHGRASAVR